MAKATRQGTDGPAIGGVLAVLLFSGIAVAAVATILYRQAAGSGAKPAKADTVVMAQIAFHPSTLVVARGATVTFENDDIAPHNVTADTPRIASGLIPPGKSFRLVVEQPFDYRCTIHPGMDAKIALAG